MPILRINSHGESSDQDTRLLAGMVPRMEQEIDMSTSADAFDRQLESTTAISGKRTVRHS